MEDNIFSGIFYGLITGFSSFLPVSALAHQYLFRYITGFSAESAFMQMMIYAGCLAAVILCCGRRLSHMRRELRIASLPKRRRKRMPDLQAVLDFKLVMLGVVPVIGALVLHGEAAVVFSSLPTLCITLIISGILAYLPQYFRDGNYDSRNLSRLDGLIMGICAGLSVIPGISRMGSVMVIGRGKGCGRVYMLELAFLYAIAMLLGYFLIYLIGTIAAGAAVLSTLVVISGILAGIAAFGGALAAIYLMRYLAVNLGFHGFSYYCWGLAVFCFIYYLIT